MTLTVRQTLSIAAPLALSLPLLAACGSDEPVDEKPGLPDVTLPDPGPDGFQLETDLIEVGPGEEVQNCYFVEVPFDHEVMVSRVTLAQNDGSHHMNVFRVATVDKLIGEPGEVVEGGECWNSPNWKDWPLLANTQNSGEVDWQLPENVALKLKPRERLMLQSHYVNATTQKTPTNGKVLVNFYGMPQGSNPIEMGTLFATNQNIRVCPGEKSSYEATCSIGRDGPVTVAAASGHFHSRGERFTMFEYSSTTAQAGAQFYESTSWDSPPFARDLNVQIPANDKIMWRCEFEALNDECGDQNDGCCFTFGGKVEFQEHCNAFVFYYPRGSTDRNCF
jgi:hypothetical protein